MNEMIIDVKTFPEPLFQLFHTETVKIRAENNEVRLIPVEEKKYSCPIIGMFKNNKTSIDSYLAEKQREKELEP